MRLGRRFDAVFVHDAVMYMATRDDLLAAARTAFDHCENGGAAVFVPDCTRETWAAGSTIGGRVGPEGSRGLGYLEWTFDPDPSDSEYTMHLVCMLREVAEVRVEHEQHRFGLFSAAEWLAVLREAGFEASTAESTDGRTALVGVRAD